MDLYLGFTFFSCAKAYKQLTGHAFAPPPFKWLWQKHCQHKHKVFFWLLLKDRLSTRDLLRRKGMELQSNECVLCTQHIDETLEHLFLLCPITTRKWAIGPAQRYQLLLQPVPMVPIGTGCNGSWYLWPSNEVEGNWHRLVVPTGSNASA